MADRLRDQVAVITGGSSGIGRAIALSFAAEGADTAIVARGPAVESVVAQVCGLGRRALAVRCDVTDPDAVAVTIAAVERELGPITLLVNAAGGTPSGWSDRPLWETPVEEWDAYVALNLRSVFLVTRAVLRAGLLARRQGRIITIGSAAGRRPSNISPYTAAKHGVTGLMARLAVELLDHGIAANTICPTAVDTPLMATSGGRDRRDAWLYPEEVAAAALYLAAGAPPHMTGQCLDLYPAGPPTLPPRRTRPADS
ncbi:MAG: SDR family oxidoreductase [Chloroflexi bacterium]|nr:SDR family oxidoreductase [Chloroflexota bacterium]